MNAAAIDKRLPPKKLLILSGIAAAINYIKALASADDVELHVGDADRFCPGLYAPRVHPVLLPRARDLEAYRQALDEVIAHRGIQYLIPTSDYDMAAVMALLNAGWTPPVRLFRPPADSFRSLSHKSRLAAVLGDRFPEHVPRTVVDQAQARSLGVPLVVKPAAEAGGKGVTIVRTLCELPAAIARLRGLFPGDILFQEYIPGDTWVLTMVYDPDGRLIVAQPMRSHQTFFTWGGGGCAGELMDVPTLVALGADMVAAVGGWCGPLNLEWRRHEETGRFMVMEANCRLNGYSYLTTMNGLNLPRIVLSLLSAAPLSPLDTRPLPQDQRVPFVLGYRERLVDNWLQPAAHEA